MIDSVSPADLVDDRAWRRLEHTLRPFVAMRVQAADVDDVVQDAFLRIQRALPGLRDDQRFGPWVYQVVRSAVMDHQRTQRRHPQASDRAGEHGPGPLELDAGSEHVEQEVAMYVALFVSLLPSPYREALTLSELEGLTQKEAAQMLGISLSAMKSRVQRGRQKLREALEECCHIALDARRRVIGCERRPEGKLPEGCCS